MGENRMQARQDQGQCEIVVRGVADWKDCLAKPIKLEGPWVTLCGGAEVPLMTYVRKEAELNVQSLERSVVTAFLNMGYQLEELEVEIESEKARGWGRCVWYKDHSKYAVPIPEMFNETAFNNPKFFHAMFKTEHADDQHFCIYSLQMMASRSILPHKTLVYRKIVFSPPLQGPEDESVAV